MISAKGLFARVLSKSHGLGSRTTAWLAENMGGGAGSLLVSMLPEALCKMRKGKENSQLPQRDGGMTSFPDRQVLAGGRGYTRVTTVTPPSTCDRRHPTCALQAETDVTTY